MDSQNLEKFRDSSYWNRVREFINSEPAQWFQGKSWGYSGGHIKEEKEAYRIKLLQKQKTVSLNLAEPGNA